MFFSFSFFKEDVYFLVFYNSSPSLGLMLDVQIDEIYTGLWGYNAFLTGASLGGNFFVLNGQTAAATIVAIVYTVIVQYAILFFFRNVIISLFSIFQNNRLNLDRS